MEAAREEVPSRVSDETNSKLTVQEDRILLLDLIVPVRYQSNLDVRDYQDVPYSSIESNPSQKVAKTFTYSEGRRMELKSPTTPVAADENDRLDQIRKRYSPNLLLFLHPLFGSLHPILTAQAQSGVIAESGN